MFKYQFGEDMLELIDKPRAVGRYPKLQLFDGDAHILSTVPESGKLSISLTMGRKLLELNRYCVEIEDFIPHGSIMAKGILNACPSIRVGDEVIFHGGRVYGVGTALMGSHEMVASTYGPAVSVRKYEVMEKR
jgi:archaeosine synthase